MFISKECSDLVVIIFVEIGVSCFLDSKQQRKLEKKKQTSKKV